MDRWREPAMEPAARGSRGGPPPYSLGALKALKRGWALTRWAGLVLLVGFGVAALIAIGIATLVTLLENSA